MDFKFDGNMVPAVSQQKFLGNSKNKNRLIAMLMSDFQSENISVFQAEEDADLLIVLKAIEMAPKADSVVIVGEDIDLLVILTSLSKNLNNIFFMKPGKRKTPLKIYNRDGLSNDTLADHIMFLHAFSGCGTTSALFNQGKTKVSNLLSKQPTLIPFVQIFENPNSTYEQIADAGQKVLLHLYGCKSAQNKTLNDFRYDCFVKS